MSNYSSGIGFNNFALSVVKKNLENREEKDRVCLLSLDAMEISPGISYNSKTDKIDGFEDCGEFGRKKKAVKQAVVFMVQGVNNPFKQVFFLLFLQKHESISNRTNDS